MGILATIDRQIQVQNATYAENEGWLADWLRGIDSGGQSDSGVSVTPRNAMTISTVWKCVNWRANQYGMLPKKICERVEINGRMTQRPAPQHPLYRIVHTNPNPTISAKAFWGLVSADLHLWGNSYAYIERGLSTGRIRNLWRFNPDMVRIDQSVSDGSIRYYISLQGKSEEEFLPDEILHIRGLGFDGIRGYSPITLMRQELGWNVATTRYGSQFFKNASRPSALISLQPGSTLKPEAKKELIEALSKSGREAGKIALIEGALKYDPMTMGQDDAQFCQTIEMQEERVIGAMGVPQHKVQVLRRSTNNNIEHQGIEAVTDCLQPLSVDIEQWVNLQCLSDDPSSGRGGGTERDRFFMDTELKALLRGDTAAQTAHIIAMRDRGIYDGNDCADYLGIPPFEGGNVRVINRAYGPMDMIREWSMTSQNNQPAKTDDSEGTARSAAASFGRIFRDAVGRVLTRKKDRHGFAVMAFQPILSSIADSLGVDDAVFITEYLGALAQRSETWTTETADDTSQKELERAINALLERGTS